MTVYSPFYSDQHVDEALSLLLTQFKVSIDSSTTQGSKLYALLVAIMNRYQEVEDAIRTVYYYSILGNATGIMVDTLGDIAGVTRLTAESDADFKVRINAQRVNNRSCGSIEDLVAFLDVYTPLSDIKVWESTGTVYVHLATTYPITDVEATLLRGTAAGGVEVVFTVSGTADYFALGSGITSIEDHDHGFSDYPSTYGGVMSTLY